MVKAQKRGKRSAAVAAVAPAPGEDANAAYLVQRTRKTEVKEYNEEAFVDLYKGEYLDCQVDIQSDASHYDGQSLVKDEAGNILVFKSMAAANLRAAQEWDSMQAETHLGFTPAPEAEQHIDTRSPRKKAMADGRAIYSRKQKYYVSDDTFDDVTHVAISSIKVEVLNASIIS